MIQALLWLLAWAPIVHAETGYATVFACDGDRWAGGPSRALRRRVQPDDYGYAHRTLPAWMPSLLVSGDGWTVAPKIDSGPYGAMVGARWTIKKRPRDPGTWRGLVDLTPPVARALGATWEQSQCRWRERVALITIRRYYYVRIQTIVQYWQAVAARFDR